MRFSLKNIIMIILIGLFSCKNNSSSIRTQVYEKRCIERINEKWNIDIPLNYEFKYNKDDRDGWIRDGFAYYVIQLNNTNGFIDEFDQNKNSDFENNFYEYLGILNVDENYNLDFSNNYQWFYKGNYQNNFDNEWIGDNFLNDLFLVYLEDTNLLFILEFFC